MGQRVLISGVLALLALAPIACREEDARFIRITEPSGPLPDVLGTYVGNWRFAGAGQKYECPGQIEILGLSQDTVTGAFGVEDPAGKCGSVSGSLEGTVKPDGRVVFHIAVAKDELKGLSNLTSCHFRKGDRRFHGEVVGDLLVVTHRSRYFCAHPVFGNGDVELTVEAGLIRN